MGNHQAQQRRIPRFSHRTPTVGLDSEIPSEAEGAHFCGPPYLGRCD
jgi:hypothetical protein